MKNYYLIHHRVSSQWKWYRKWHEKKYANLMHIGILWLVGLLGLLIIVGAASTPVDLVLAQTGSVYYVATDGNDNDSGTEFNPWRTINRAVAQVGPGDTVYVRGGVYNERVNFDNGNSGNALDGYITYSSYPGEIAILDGSSVGGWGGGFMSGLVSNTRSVSYIVIKDFEIRNYPESGIILEAVNGIGAHHIIIDGVETHHNDNAGIYVVGGIGSATTHHIEIRNCHAHHNLGDDHGIKFNGDDDGVLNREHVHDSIVENCIANDNHHQGIYSSTGNYNIIFRNNMAYNNGWAGIGAHEMWDSTYENNVVYNNGYGDSEYMPDCIVVYDSRNMIIQHNTVADCPYGINIEGSNNIARNNIFYNNRNGVHTNQATFDYNLWYGGVYSGRGTHSITADPQFVNPLIRDYHLQSSSSAIDAGAPIGVDTDYEGNARPQAGGYDIGAYEYGSGTPLPSPRDTIPPVVNSFNLQPLTTDSSITATWQVSDDVLLRQVELWRAEYENDGGADCDEQDKSGCNWAGVPGQTQNILGISASGQFTDSPAVGTWWYGLHVLDQADNPGYEPDPPGAIKVVKTSSSGPPSGAIIIDGNDIYQVIDGFGATVSSGWNDWGTGDAWPGEIDMAALAADVVNELGMTVARIEFPRVECGDKTADCRATDLCDFAGVEEDHMCNDNADANLINATHFRWAIDNDFRFDKAFIQALIDAGLNRFQMSMWNPASWLKTDNSDRYAACHQPADSSYCIGPEDNCHLCLAESDELSEHVIGVFKDLQSRFKDANGNSINIAWFSPVNEPNVGPTWEGPGSMKDIVDLFSGAFVAEGMSVEVVAPETSHCNGWSWIGGINQNSERVPYAAFHQYPNSFVNPEHSGYVSDLTGVGALQLANGSPMKKMQTEFSNFWAAGGNMTTGFQDSYEEGFLTAWHMHQGLTIGNFNMWMWWQLVKQWQSDTPDQFWTRNDGTQGWSYYPRGAGQRLVWLDAVESEYEKTPKYYAFRMFSRFVRPGMVRVGVNNMPSDLRVSAYKNDSGETTVVVLNVSDSDLNMPQIQFQDISPEDGFYRYSYNPDNMMGKSSSRINLSGGNILSDSQVIPAKSIVTYSTIDDGIEPQDIPVGGSVGGGGGGGGTIPPGGGEIKSDFNCDDKVDLVDFAILLSYWNTDGSGFNLGLCGRGPNIDALGVVNEDDLSILFSCWGVPTNDICFEEETLPGECISGEEEEQECGNCGTQSRTCTSDEIWGSWGSCEDEGVCSPVARQDQSCTTPDGLIGSQFRTCLSTCTWGGWSTCAVTQTCPDAEVDTIYAGCQYSLANGHPLTQYTCSNSGEMCYVCDSGGEVNYVWNGSVCVEVEPDTNESCSIEPGKACSGQELAVCRSESPGYDWYRAPIGDVGCNEGLLCWCLNKSGIDF